MAQTLGPQQRIARVTDVTVAMPRNTPWPWQSYLALAAIPFLVWQGWTIVGWLSKHPYQITEYRDTGSYTYVVARVLEAGMVVLAAAILTHVVRNCLRQRRLTWDAQLCIATTLLYWQDPLNSFYEPVLLYSSQWTNLINWCSQAPFVVNPECGRTPEPVIFIGLFYVVGWLVGTMLAGRLVRRLQTRNPHLSVAKQIGIFAVLAVVGDLVLEVAMTVMHLWNYPSSPDAFSLLPGEHRYPLFLAVTAAIVLTPMFAIRHFKDDRGRTIFERGMDHLNARRRTALSLMATIGFTQMLIVAGNLSFLVAAPYSGPWPEYPAHIINGLCDNGQFTNTRYGPCPGEPGFRAPVRDLPGKNPPAR